MNFISPFISRSPLQFFFFFFVNKLFKFLSCTVSCIKADWPCCNPTGPEWLLVVCVNYISNGLIDPTNSLKNKTLKWNGGILLEAKSVNMGMIFTVSSCQSEDYPIRRWHMVWNKAFVLWDLKIRIEFPLNQWAVCFTAMNNASPLQTCISHSHTFSLSSLAQCLQCLASYSVSSVFIPLHFIIKWRSRCLSSSATSLSLNDPPRLADEDSHGYEPEMSMIWPLKIYSVW